MMKGSYIYYIMAMIFAAFIIAVAVFFLLRRRAGKKVRQMPYEEKVRLLDEAAAAFGFAYVKDFFTSRLSAWQRGFGYEALFDKTAGYFQMIIDTWPVYFDYGGKTWLIEFWKGQYGINTGAEIGVYHADRILRKEEYASAHFETAKDEELPKLWFCLKKKGKSIACMESRHWWLTAFRTGEFSRPKDLCLLASVTFLEQSMAESFFREIRRSGPSADKCHLRGNEVSVRMDFTEIYPWWNRWIRTLIQLWNLILCRLYLQVTKPFTSTLDRMIFLYCLLPGCFRRVLRFARIPKLKKRRGL